MGLLKKLGEIFRASGKPEGMVTQIAVQCLRCGEIIQSRIDLRNELSVQYEDSGQPTYICRKELMSAEGRCFQRIDIELTFDANRRLLQQEVRGGRFVDPSPAT